MAESTTNSITLSPDLNTLYLIDNDRAIAFNLRHRSGINIGTLNGQLTVSTALPVPIPRPVEEDSDDPDTPIDDPGTGPDDNPIHRLASIPRQLKIATANRQFALMFNPTKGIFSIIGASDIDVSIIGASDIDVSIIGASDLDVSLTARIDPPGEDPEPTNGGDATEEQGKHPKCYLFSFRISKQTINLRKVGTILVVQY